VPLLVDPLPTVTDELFPLPPGEMVVLPLSPFGPVVMEVELLVELVFGGFRSGVVTTRHGLPLTMTVPFGPEVTATLSATAGTAAISPATRTEMALP
jgi:hypothetical protein